MQLTKTEEKMLNGEFGPAVELSMRVLTKLGDALEADRMVKISSVHHLGEYSSLHVAGVKIVEKYAELGGKYIVPTTPNPASISLCRCDDYCKEFLVDEEYASWQWRSVRANQKLGIIPIWSCTPYYHCNIPHFGQHIAWTESSAVIFANSVLGAKTNRHTAGVDVAAAIAGRVPRMGMHLEENRRGSLLIEVENLKLTEPVDFAILGYFMGSVAEGDIPVISGIKHANHDDLMYLGAAATGPGGMPLYHVLGITPEARTTEEAFRGEKPEDKVSFGPKEHEETKERICTSSSGEVDCIVIGCPHAPLNEIADVARLLDGKKIHRHVEFYVQTSKVVEELARRMGLAQTIEQAGAKIWPDTCLIISTTRRRGFETLMTTSAKFAYYTPIEVEADVILANIKDCVNAAINGEV